jgi:Protein of unknown function, DUF488
VVQPRSRTVRRVRPPYREELKDAERAQAFEHLRELAGSGTLTLLTATKHPEISKAAVLADLIRAEPSRVGLHDRLHTCLFDLDGVLTKTAMVHAAAWKQMFHAYLRDRAARTGERFGPFGAVAKHSTAAVGRRTMFERDHPLKGQ